MLARKTFFLIYKVVFVRIMKIIITLADILLSLPIVIISSWKSKESIPAITDKLLLTPAIVLASRIREGNVTSEQVVRAFISRIKDVNPILNAVVEDRYLTAIKEAKTIDNMIFKRMHTPQVLEKKYPLLGVPVTVKEAIAVSGMSHSAGMICSRKKACKDAEVVRKIKDAGAIVLAVTNTPELCMNWECFNKVTGKTSNPYDNRRTCGGSSGGEAALISAAASVIGIGSDTLGSLRLPAHFCGIFSHKPTPSLVSIEGHFPMAEEAKLWEKVFTLGPMTRYSIDLPLLLNIICKDELKYLLNLDKKVDFSTLTIFYMESWDHELTHSVTPEIRRAIHKTTQYFREKYNTQIEKWQNLDLSKVADMSLASIISIKGTDDIFNKNSDKSAVAELIKYFIGLSNHTLFPVCYPLLHRYLPFYDIRKTRGRIQTAIDSMLKYLGDNGVLICPTFPIEATFHGELLTKSYNNIYMSTFNSLGVPVTVCPAGFTKKGLPIGLQIVGKPYADYLTIAVAQEIELAFGGWRKP